MNIIWPESGKYIVAVSGGVDSVCLLDMLVAHGGYELVVVHVDHGLREDSSQDAELVRKKSKEYGIPFLTTELKMKKESSEDQARQARYDFLFEVMKQQNAQAIVTAHHGDDLLETSIINVMRGTDRYGAAGGMRREGIIRPLINVSKQQLLEYAVEHQLKWREDSTNQDAKYTRNRIRHETVPAIDKATYHKHVVELAELNKKLDSLLNGKVSLKNRTATLPRTTLNQLGLRELEVLLAYALRQIDPTIELSQPQIARLAREILLDATKNSFSYMGTAGIIIEIL